MNVSDIQQRVDHLQHEAYAARKRFRQEKIAFVKTRQLLRDHEQAFILAQNVAQMVQQQAHQQVAGVVTSCLYSVFGEDKYAFRIKFVRKQNRTEAQLLLVWRKNNAEILDPANEDSGGVLKIAAFVIRVACLVLSKPALRKFLVLDEPFSDVSAQYRPAVRAMVLELSKKFGIQFVLVTHEPEYMMGKVIKL